MMRIGTWIFDITEILEYLNTKLFALKKFRVKNKLMDEKHGNMQNKK